MKKLIGLLWVLLILFNTGHTQPPPGYYDPAQGLYGQALLQALHGIIDNHTVVSYSSLWTHYQVTDKKANNKVWDMYSDVPGGNPPYEFTFITDQCGSYSGEGDCYNREHSWPVSWFGDVAPMNSDMFHIYPTDGFVNGKRSNYPYGEVSNANWTSENGGKLGNCSFPGYSGTVFEPIDDYKGDFARSYFYMSTRYYSQDASWPGSDMTNGAQLKPWALTMMLQWSDQDPVSVKETDRNNAIYQIQHNRNPFIDNPQWAHEIWDPGAGINNGRATNHTLIINPNPAADECRISVASFPETPVDQLIVYSLSGAVTYCPQELKGNTIYLNTSHLYSGLYFITALSFDKQEVYRGKLIVR